jgi:hypothetical protein
MRPASASRAWVKAWLRQAGAGLVHPLGDVGDAGQDLGRAARAFDLFLARCAG